MLDGPEIALHLNAIFLQSVVKSCSLALQSITILLVQDKYKGYLYKYLKKTLQILKCKKNKYVAPNTSYGSAAMKYKSKGSGLN